ncbi:MAG: signal peptidase I [Nitrospirae bacterium]|nr:signal peptidase I [Nitrospirota bacterium]
MAREYIEAIVTALILALLIRSFVVQAFKIPSGSMIPTLLIGDHLLVNKFVYGVEIPLLDKKVLTFSSPKKGDIIVFKFPQDQTRDFIKRVIATSGDTVEIVNQKIYVNGKILNEPYIRHVDNSGKKDVPKRDILPPLTVPEGDVFVMGDNRDQSYDSRYWGFVDLSLVRGKAMLIYWSWDNEKMWPFFNGQGWPRFDRIGGLVK